MLIFFIIVVSISPQIAIVYGFVFPLVVSEAVTVCYSSYRRLCQTVGSLLQVIPYTGPIPGGLHTGEIIIIQGTVPSDADR